MHLLYTDETNTDFNKDGVEFFVYAGLSVPGENAGALSDQIKDIRRGLGIASDYKYKFNPGPTGLTHQDFIELKKQSIQACVEHNCKLLASIVHKGICKDGDPSKGIEMGLNTILYHFDFLMHREDSSGLVLIDRLPEKTEPEIRNRVQEGLEGMPYSAQYELKKLMGFHFSWVGQTAFSSLIDVCLGSLRFAVNAFTSNDDNEMASAKAMLRQMSSLLIRDDNNEIDDLSVAYRPKQVISSAYRERYDNLRKFIDENTKVA